MSVLVPPKPLILSWARSRCLAYDYCFIQPKHVRQINSSLAILLELVVAVYMTHPFQITPVLTEMTSIRVIATMDFCGKLLKHSVYVLTFRTWLFFTCEGLWIFAKVISIQHS